MKTKNILKHVQIAIGILTILVSINGVSYAMVTDENRGEAAPAIESDQIPQYAPGEILVKFKEGTNPSSIIKEAGIEAQGIERIHSIKPAVSKFRKEYKLEKDPEGGWYSFLGKKYKEISDIPDEEMFKEAYKNMPEIEKSLYRSYKINLPEGMSVEKAISKLNNNPYVKYAQPNGINTVQAFPATLPNDTYVDPNQDGLWSIGGWTQGYEDMWGLQLIQADKAWQTSQGDGVIVAVIDTGVDYNHPDLAANIWTNIDEIPDNGIDDDGNGYKDDIRGWDFAYNDKDPMDGHGHGTHCAGTIAAIGNNGLGIIGVAPNAKIMVVKGLSNLGSGYDSGLKQCLVYAADNGAKVISCSWGPKDRRPSNPELEEGVNYAYSKGCVVVFSAGNNEDDVQYYSPANMDVVISVVATNQNDKKCTFSNWGPAITICAPGGDDPIPDDNNAIERNILSLQSGNNGRPTDMYHDQKSIMPEQCYRSKGTSMACPHVSGVAALILSANPDAENTDIKGIIRASADDTGRPDRVSQYGYGRINAYRACNAKGISAVIDSPHNGDYVQGAIEIRGSAAAESGFQKYELYYAPKENPQDIKPITTATIPVINGVLGVINTTLPFDGEKIITLKVYHSEFGVFTYSTAIIIDNYNQPPDFVDLSGIDAVIGRQTEFNIEAVDSDNPGTPWGQLVYSVDNLPPGATFNPSSRLFTWAPTAEQKGTYETTFVVSDNENITRKKITIGTLQIAETKLTENPTAAWLRPTIHNNKIVWESNVVYDISTGQMMHLPIRMGMPVIWGDRIAFERYSGLAPYDTNIFVYDLKTGDETQITSELTPQWNPQIWEDKIVWQDETDRNAPQIYLHDLSKGETVRISPTTASQRGPYIHNNKIVWWDTRERWDRIYMYDVEKEQEKLIDAQKTSKSTCVIYGDKIAWQTPSMGAHAIYLYDLSTETTTKITSDYGATAIYDDKLIWSAGSGSSRGFGLFLYDISTGRQTQLTSNTQYVQLTEESIYQDMIVYSDNQGEPPPMDTLYDMYLLRLIYSPNIFSIDPPEAMPSSLITIKGRHFGYVQKNSSVIFAGNISAHVESWSDKEIVCKVPDTAVTGDIKIATEGGESNKVAFTVLPKNYPPTCKFVSIMNLLTINKPYPLVAYYSDPDGGKDIDVTEVMINNTSSPSNCMYIRYDKRDNKLYMRSDDGSSWLGGYAPRSDNIIQNSYGKIYCARSYPTYTGTTAQFISYIEFKEPLAGAKNIYLNAIDTHSAESGWQNMKNIKISIPPKIVSLSPNSGTFLVGTPYNFTTKVADSDNYTNINTVTLYLTPNGLDTTQTFYAYYRNNQLWVRALNGRYIGGYAPGSNKVIDGPYGNLNCAQTRVNGIGKELTIDWNISFKQAITTRSGQQDVYVTATNFWSSGPKLMGTVGITGPNKPAMPTNLTATAFTNKVILSWTPGADTTIFGIDRADDQRIIFMPLKIFAKTPYTDTKNIVPGKTYYYRVRALTSKGQSEWSNIAKVIVPR